MNRLSKFIELTATEGTRPRIELKSGLTMSIQGGKNSYSNPKGNWNTDYTTMEVGFPSEVVQELLQYAKDIDEPLDTVYAYVPVKVLVKIVQDNGGYTNNLIAGK